MTHRKEELEHAKGKVVKAFGNLLNVAFEGDIRQGEVAMVDLEGVELKAEVIEITGSVAKLQVFEDTKEISLNTPVRFTGDLLEAELGPGLLSTIYDGLQNPLKEVADTAGLFLPRGIYLNALDRDRKWEFEPIVAIDDVVKRGDTIGTTLEGRFHHRVMVPFSLYDKYTVTWVAKPGSYPVDEVIVKAKDRNGKEHAFTMVQKWPIKSALIEGEKVKPTRMMTTGSRILDTQVPVVKGGTFCSPGPFGAGKTVLQHHLAKYSSVDIVVVVACGERAGEVVEMLREFPHLIDPHTGETLITRTVMICNTSSMPVAARESSVYLGITIAEYYRQMGRDVLLLADSTSRWAQALREMSGRLEEIPGEEAFPAYLSSRIADFYERSGVVSLGEGNEGSVTIGGAVSPAGGNFEEPVTQATLAKVGAFHGLSKERSDARKYPAVDPLISFSIYINDVGRELDAKQEGWSEMVKKADWFLRSADDIRKRMEVVGEEGTALDDVVIYLKGNLYDFSYLQQNAFDPVDAYSSLERQITQFTLINRIFDTPFHFESHDEARQFFLSLQNQVKNLNYINYNSGEYRTALSKIEELIETRKLSAV